MNLRTFNLKAQNFLEYLGAAVLDFLLPRHCSVCRRRLLVGERTVCARCNGELPRTRLWLDGDDNRFARMFYGRFPVVRAVAYIHFVPHSRTAGIVYDFKYHGDFSAAVDMGYMAGAEIAAESEFFDGVEVIVPVPVSRRRLRERRYNQSEMLADGISRATGLPVEPGVLRRKSFRVSQTALTPDERLANVQSAFRLKHTERLRGKHILIVDDIITTGATVSECARTLGEIDGVRISVFAFGWTKRTPH